MLWTTGQTLLYGYIFQIFRKTAKATSIRPSGLYLDFKLKYCDEEIFFSRATLAINICCTKFLIFLEILNTAAKYLQ